MSSFSIPLSGMLASEQALNVISDNIANSNTQGFKSNSVLFQDAMNTASASLQVGAGVGGTLTTRNFTQGTVQTTGGALDAAIQGGGFFVMQNPSGAITYTRDGSFSLSPAGQLVSSDGSLVQGWTAVNGVVNPSGAVSSISVPSLSSQAPTPTSNMTVSANLNASATVGDSFSAPVQVVDSLGNTHTLTVDFTNTAPLTWSYNVTIPGEDVTGGTAGTPTSLTTGSLTFSSGGVLTSPAAGSPVNVATSGGLADGAADLKINWNLFDTTGSPLITQYASASTTTGSTQDGVQAATVTGVNLQNGGSLVAAFSNGTHRTLAQLAVASISNPDTLLAVNNNQYVVGVGTSTPSVGASGTSTRGNIVAGSLEASNVDMATELTNLIVYQRGYQADSKAVTAIDQMQQTLLAMNL
ncbi:MAG TPA: flagellar hook protein FlgE [Bryobacteraceae bacterium]|nr:flagellar hook protein FlgE [Bryobacteraceae bacterium]